MILRDTPAMGILLAIHLGVVLGLFLSLPYGKFVHGLYRFLALVKYAVERRQGTFVERPRADQSAATACTSTSRPSCTSRSIISSVLGG